MILIGKLFSRLSGDFSSIGSLFSIWSKLRICVLEKGMMKNDSFLFFSVARLLNTCYRSVHAYPSTTPAKNVLTNLENKHIVTNAKSIKGRANPRESPQNSFTWTTQTLLPPPPPLRILTHLDKCLLIMLSPRFCLTTHLFTNHHCSTNDLTLVFSPSFDQHAAFE